MTKFEIYDGCKKSPHAKYLWLVPFLLVALISAWFHVISVMSLPLVPHPDSMSHLEGAVTFAKHFSLEGVGSARTPGLALIYGAFFLLFGSYATWPLQIFLHFIAWSSVLLVYGIGWELTSKHIFAFWCGMLAAIWPEYIYFSNVLLTEMPSGFFNILALYAALRFINKQRLFFLYLTFISGSYAVLVRPEYLLNYFTLALLFSVWLCWKKKKDVFSSDQFTKIARHLFISCLIAIIPILLWSYRNYTSYHFFGLTSYTGDALYDGFVVAGNTFGIPVMDENSPAIKSLKEAFKKDKSIAIEKAQPWPEWRNYGVNTYNDGMSLLKFSGGPWMKTISPVFKRAAIDSIIANPYASFRLAAKKVYVGLKEATWTVGWYPATGHMPGESETSTNGWVETFSYVFLAKPGIGDYLSFKYIPAVNYIKLQRRINSIYISHTKSIYYAVWRYLALIGFILCASSKPFFSWTLFLVFTFNIVIMPFVLGFPLGRYGVPGGLLLIILFSAVILAGINLFKKVSGNPAESPAG